MCSFVAKSWSFHFHNGFTLANSLFGTIKFNKNPEKYYYFGYDISFALRGTFSLPNRWFGKNVKIFGADMSLSAYVGNKNKDILILGKGPIKKFYIDFRSWRSH